MTQLHTHTHFSLTRLLLLPVCWCVLKGWMLELEERVDIMPGREPMERRMLAVLNMAVVLERWTCAVDCTMMKSSAALPGKRLILGGEKQC